MYRYKVWHGSKSEPLEWESGEVLDDDDIFYKVCSLEKTATLVIPDAVRGGEATRTPPLLERINRAGFHPIRVQINDGPIRMVK